MTISVKPTDVQISECGLAFSVVFFLQAMYKNKNINRPKRRQKKYAQTNKNGTMAHFSIEPEYISFRLYYVFSVRWKLCLY